MWDEIENENVAGCAITPVEDNFEKGMSYKANIRKYNLAIKKGFYFEAMWIVYALLEDRTSALLYYLGCIDGEKRNAATRTKKIKKQLREVFNMDENDKYRFDTFSGKCTRITELCTFAKAGGINMSPYKTDLVKAVEKISSFDFIDELDYLNNEWRNKRNELIHALLNKNDQAVYLEMEHITKMGFEGFRIIDNAVQKIKKMNIRGKYKIQ